MRQDLAGRMASFRSYGLGASGSNPMPGQPHGEGRPVRLGAAHLDGATVGPPYAERRAISRSVRRLREVSTS